MVVIALSGLQLGKGAKYMNISRRSPTERAGDSIAHLEASMRLATGAFFSSTPYRLRSLAAPRYIESSDEI